MTGKIKLWSFADVDRSGKVRWTACELGYEIEEVKVNLGEHASDPYRQMNPYEQIPTAELDGKILIESTAICLSLAERHPEAALIPSDQAVRDHFWQSINLSASSLEIPAVQYYLSRAGFMDETWTGLLEGPLGKRINVFASDLPDTGYICGDFTLADICAAYVLRLGVQAKLLPFEGKLETYMRRLMARPASRAARIFDSLEV
ncbi:MAG: glutathione S-transferase family protein [Xanthomonadales bacterium]|nr:glutathione S-transferase family protein [Gammaproteobacteria bacterium]MBT8054062.1 glutathione S-transferase family protein [Gammaproteobacteria bacterium]NNK50336.1 glutathione S-transferase family protein [Xanthomonadales bacterium]